jgi:hypothetical protein
MSTTGWYEVVPYRDDVVAALAGATVGPVNDVSLVPAAGTVSPLSLGQLVDIFGTTMPTTDQVARWAKQSGRGAVRGRGEGVYVVSYGANGAPDHLHFAVA